MARTIGKDQATEILEDAHLWHDQAAAALVKGLTTQHWDPSGYALIFSRLSDVLVELETLNDTMDRIADALTGHDGEGAGR